VLFDDPALVLDDGAAAAVAAAAVVAMTPSLNRLQCGQLPVLTRQGRCCRYSGSSQTKTAEWTPAEKCRNRSPLPRSSAIAHKPALASEWLWGKKAAKLTPGCNPPPFFLFFIVCYIKVFGKGRRAIQR
jgi:hypothetical protein